MSAVGDPEQKTILVVDDVALVRRSVARILKQAGYRVCQAVDGLDALRVVEEEQVDLVLTDVVMPRLGGVELIAKLRETRPELRVLVMTAYAGKALIDVPMLQKPFMPDDLLGLIERTLAGGNAAEASATAGDRPARPGSSC